MSAILFNLSPASCWCNWHTQALLLLICGGKEKKKGKEGYLGFISATAFITINLVHLQGFFYYFKPPSHCHSILSSVVNKSGHSQWGGNDFYQVCISNTCWAQLAFFLQLAICIWWWSLMSLIFSIFRLGRNEVWSWQIHSAEQFTFLLKLANANWSQLRSISLFPLSGTTGVRPQCQSPRPYGSGALKWLPGNSRWCWWSSQQGRRAWAVQPPSFCLFCSSFQSHGATRWSYVE